MRRDEGLHDGTPARKGTLQDEVIDDVDELGFIEEAVALRRADLVLPARGRGRIILTAACPRTGAAWTSTGTPFEPRGLKHRPGGTIRLVPIPPVLVTMLHRHLGDHGTTTDGRLFRGTRGGMPSESVYGRAWHAARQAALGPGRHRARPPPV